MYGTRVRASIVVAVAALIALGGCTTAPEPAVTTPTAVPDCAGVAISVSFDILGADPINTCASFSNDEPVTAAEALELVGITTEGTVEYGTAVICRVNGLPASDTPFTVEGEEPYTETCDTMPPAFAYWALWIKQAGVDEWGYAMEGIDTQIVKSGDALGLVFSTGGATPTPEG